MPMLRASTLGLLGVTLVGAASCDGSSDVLPLRSLAGVAGRLANGRGGEGGEGGEGGAVDAARGGSSAKSSGGASSGSGGTGASSSKAGHGGTGTSGGTGGNPGVLRGGTGGRGESAGAAGTSDTAGAGGTAAPEQLSLCIRLGTSSTALDERVTLDFEDGFFDDCRVNWVVELYYDESKNLDQRYRFLSQVGQFNYALWGCALTSPPESFDLIYTPHPLTRADANVLIDAYVRAASKDLSMSPDEISAMRAILVRLSEPLLISPDPGGFSQSRCDVTSGTGGAGGEGGGAGNSGAAGDGAHGGRGSGGAPSSGGAGTAQAGAG
jgi:hypothetical protein